MKSSLALMPALLAAIGLTRSGGISIFHYESTDNSPMWYPSLRSRSIGSPPASWHRSSQRARRKAARWAHAAGCRFAFA